jgi:hypothetical protein
MFDCSRRWADLASRYLELATNPDVSQLVTTLEPKGTGPARP